VIIVGNILILLLKCHMIILLRKQLLLQSARLFIQGINSLCLFMMVSKIMCFQVLIGDLYCMIKEILFSWSSWERIVIIEGERRSPFSQQKRIYAVAIISSRSIGLWSWFWRPSNTNVGVLFFKILWRFEISSYHWHLKVSMVFQIIYGFFYISVVIH
jgi:hypothetical protein